MRTLTVLIFTLIIVTSCQNGKISQLNKRIIALEEQNAELRDSLNRNEYRKIISSGLVGMPHGKNVIANQSNMFTFFLQTQQRFPDYNIYQITRNGTEEKRTLLYENYNQSTFEFDFVPKSDKDLSFELLAEFDLDSIKVLIPSIINTSMNN